MCLLWFLLFNSHCLAALNRNTCGQYANDGCEAADPAIIGNYSRGSSSNVDVPMPVDEPAARIKSDTDVATVKEPPISTEASLRSEGSSSSDGKCEQVTMDNPHTAEEGLATASKASYGMFWHSTVLGPNGSP